MTNSNTNNYGNWYDKLVGKSIVEKKYLHEGETDAHDLADRVSSMFSADIKDKLHDAILNADFLPAGRILYAAGSEGKFKASYSNCYVESLNDQDSLEAIFDTCKEIARTFSLGGGVGLRISSLRPNGAIVRNSAKTSTGAVSFMDIFNSIGEVVGSNNRRAALLLALDCWHPDIEEFLDIKQNNDKLQSANISILFTDEFMQAVLDNKEYELHFYVNATGEEIKKTINAKDFFYKFCEKQFDYAEPGALWKDRLDQHHLLSGYPKDIYQVECVNPCSEFSGNAYNSCCLGSINLYNCIDSPFTTYAALNEYKFAELVDLGIITLDEVLDIGYNNQPLDENRKCIDDWRSVGLGLFGIADALVALGMRYGSDKSVKFIKYVTEFMMERALRTSAYLAKKKGTFGKYDWKYVKESDFVKKLKENNPYVYDKIEKYGLRNGSLLSIAPTGSTSLMCGCTGGVEPIYEVSYERTTHALEKTGKTFKVFALSVEHLLRHNNIDPNTITVKEIKEQFPYVVDTYDIEPSERVDFQAAMQENIDNAISSTINLRETATVEDIYNTYIRAWSMGCKGITVFRDNCARISILGKEKTKVDEKPVLQEPIVKPTLNTLTPLKRGNIKSLWGRTWVFKTACVRKLYVTVNLLDDDIFEVFVGADTGCQANINTITRLTSYALRLGGKVEDIIAELNSAICPACVNAKKSDPTINKSCASCIADALKEMTSIVHKGKNIPIEDMKVSKIEPVDLKMIKTDDNKVDFLECPECHAKTLRPEGRCFSCNNCGFSKCN